MNDPNENRPGYKETKVGWIPEEWKCTTLDGVKSSDKWSITGGPFGSNLKVSDYTDQGVRVIQLQDIGDGYFCDSSRIYTSTEKADELKSCNIYPGEIILSKMGDPVARACFMPDFEKRYLMASDGIRLKVDDAEWDRRFVLYLVNSDRVRNVARRWSIGSTRQRIGLDDLKKLPLYQPARGEQFVIAEILSASDEAIERVGDLIRVKKRQKKALMQHLLTGRIRLPGFAKSRETIDTRTGKIPSDWKWVHLGEVFKKRVERSGDALPLMAITIDSGMVRRDSIDRKVDSELTESDNLVVRKGDIAYNTMRMWQGAVGVAEEDCHVSPAYVVCSPKVGVSDSKFFYYWFKSAEGLHLLWSYSYGITGDRLRLYADDFSLVSAPLPSIEEQQAIVAVIGFAEEEIAQLQKKQTALKRQKKALMQKLLTGQIRVKV